MSDVSVVGLDCGWMRTQRRTLIAGGGIDEMSIPVPSWLIRHPKGDVLFDVGLHPDLAADDSMLGSLAGLFRVDLDPGGSIGHRLEQHDIDPADPLTVVVSHCHFDHVGGLVQLPNARVLIQGDELREARRGGPAYDPGLIDLGHELVELSGAHDVFGDGTVTCIPTPGHTCGHQSLRVLTDEGTTILAADACYFAHTLDDEVLPPFAHDLGRQRASLAMLQRERAAGTRIVPGHDADVFRRLRRP